MFQFDDLSHKSSASSLSTTQQPPSAANVAPPSNLASGNSLENLAGGEFLRRTSATPPVKPPRIPLGSDKAVDEWEQKLFGKQGKGG